MMVPENKKDNFILNITYHYKNSVNILTDNFNSNNKIIPHKMIEKYYEHVLSQYHRGKKIYKKVMFFEIKK